MKRSVASWVVEKHQCSEKEKRLRNLLLANGGLPLDDGGLTSRINLNALDTEELLIKVLNHKHQLLQQKQILQQKQDDDDGGGTENSIVDVNRESRRLFTKRPRFTDIKSVREFILQMGRTIIACNPSLQYLGEDFNYIAYNYGLAQDTPVAENERIRREMRDYEVLNETLNTQLTQSNMQLTNAETTNRNLQDTIASLNKDLGTQQEYINFLERTQTEYNTISTNKEQDYKDRLKAVEDRFNDKISAEKRVQDEWYSIVRTQYTSLYDLYKNLKNKYNTLVRDYNTQQDKCATSINRREAYIREQIERAQSSWLQLLRQHNINVSLPEIRLPEQYNASDTGVVETVSDVAQLSPSNAIPSISSVRKNVRQSDIEVVFEESQKPLQPLPNVSDLAQPVKHQQLHLMRQRPIVILQTPQIEISSDPFQNVNLEALQYFYESFGCAQQNGLRACVNDVLKKLSNNEKFVNDLKNKLRECQNDYESLQKFVSDLKNKLRECQNDYESLQDEYNKLMSISASERRDLQDKLNNAELNMNWDYTEIQDTFNKKLQAAETDITVDHAMYEEVKLLLMHISEINNVPLVLENNDKITLYNITVAIRTLQILPKFVESLLQTLNTCYNLDVNLQIVLSNPKKYLLSISTACAKHYDDEEIYDSPTRDNEEESLVSSPSSISTAITPPPPPPPPPQLPQALPPNVPTPSTSTVTNVKTKKRIVPTRIDFEDDFKKKPMYKSILEKYSKQSTADEKQVMIERSPTFPKYQLRNLKRHKRMKGKMQYTTSTDEEETPANVTDKKYLKRKITMTLPEERRRKFNLDDEDDDDDNVTQKTTDEEAYMVDTN
nr:hypothetical protein [Cnaphalocrocis medinalis granulovirus]